MDKDLVYKALGYYNTRAIPGDGHAEEVLRMFREAGHAEIKNDEVPWCSAFMNAVAWECGLPMTRSLMARSWLKVGTIVTKPEVGDVCILWRGSKEGIFGHVGIFIREENGIIWLLGGNQGNHVSIAPFSTANLLGYRRLIVQ